MSVQESALETLQRWETAGGHWQVLSLSSSGLVVALLRCDRGEEVHRFASPDPALAAYIGDRQTDEDAEDAQRDYLERRKPGECGSASVPRRRPDR